MKKILSLLASVFLLFTAACGGGGEDGDNNEAKKQDTKKDVLTADMLLTSDDVKSLVTYEPAVTMNNTAFKTSVRYDSDPVGKSDPVIVELYAPNEYKSAADIKFEFSTKKEKRPKSKDVEDLGLEAYIAYPSLNMYRDGYMVVVTAGSGSGDEQDQLLKSAGTIAAKHLDEYIKANPNAADGESLSSEQPDKTTPPAKSPSSGADAAKNG